jgi:hypothetical protein
LGIEGKLLKRASKTLYCTDKKNYFCLPEIEIWSYTLRYLSTRIFICPFPKISEKFDLTPKAYIIFTRVIKIIYPITFRSLNAIPENDRWQLGTNSRKFKTLLDEKKKAEADELNSDKYFSVEQIDKPGFITFVDTKEKFANMCSYFENTKTDVIGKLEIYSN